MFERFKEAQDEQTVLRAKAAYDEDCGVVDIIPNTFAIAPVAPAPGLTMGPMRAAANELRSAAGLLIKRAEELERLEAQAETYIIFTVTYF